MSTRHSLRSPLWALVPFLTQPHRFGRSFGIALLGAVSFCTAPLAAKADGPNADNAKKTEVLNTRVDRLAQIDKTDYQGRKWDWKELAGEKGTVVVFLGTECPLAKQYTPRVVELEKKFQNRGIKFITVDPNIQDSLAEMGAHARRFQLDVPFLKDPDQSLADLLGITRTPEVCLVDSSLVVRYRGRIDDQFGIGFAREKASQSELKDAIDALLENRDIAIPSTSASGCLIGRVRKKEESNADSEAITYAKHVSHILNERCVSCHRQGDIGPMDLSNFDDASAWADMIVEVTQNRTMPPWHATDEYASFQNDRRLSEKELEIGRAHV